MTRKNFIGGVIATGVTPTIVPSNVFGANAPSNRITLGGVGVGGIGDRQLPLAKEAGFEIKMCKVRSPQTKGKVESSNRFLSRLMAYQGDFEGEDEL